MDGMKKKNNDAPGLIEIFAIGIYLFFKSVKEAIKYINKLEWCDGNVEN